MRRSDRPHRLSASIAALALVVPASLVGLAPSAVTAPPDLSASDLAAPLEAEEGAGSIEPLDTMPWESVAEPVASTTTLALTSGIAVFGHAVTAKITLVVPGGTPTGSVQVLLDGQAVASGDVGTDGTVRVPLPASVAVGRHVVTAAFAGATGTDPPLLSSSSGERTLTVTQTLPSVRVDGTDWSVRRVDPKVIRIQVLGAAGVEPTGKVEVWVNGSRAGSATLDPSGEAVVNLASSTRTALVVVTYRGDETYLPWIASPRLLIVR